MIISGGSRSNWRFFGKHLTRTDENERAELVEIRGLCAETIPEALREMDFIASGTRTKNSFYHADLNPRADEVLTPEQWELAVDTLEEKLGLEGQARFIVEHEKNGRIHRHVVWSRIDPDTMTAIHDGHNFRKHELASREIEEKLDLEPVKGAHIRDKENEPRPERRPDNREVFRGHRSGISPDAVKAELTELWQATDSGKAFAAALAERGYILAKGDGRDFVVLDGAGDTHSIARRVSGAKAKDIRARMADIDRDALPSVDEAKTDFKARQTDTPDERQDEHRQELPQPSPTPVSAVAADVHAVMERNDGNLEHVSGIRGIYGRVKEHLAALMRDEKSGTPTGLNEAAVRKFSREVTDVMTEHGGELLHGDGLSFWERGLLAASRPLLAYGIERAVEKVAEVADKITRHWRNSVDPAGAQSDNESLSKWAQQVTQKDAPEPTQEQARDKDKGIDR